MVFRPMDNPDSVRKNSLLRAHNTEQGQTLKIDHVLLDRMRYYG
jgi:hypothetical protein